MFKFFGPAEFGFISLLCANDFFPFSEIEGPKSLIYEMLGQFLLVWKWKQHSFKAAFCRN